MVEWASRFADHDDGGVTFALEDCRHLTRRLESDLLSAGQSVIRVPTRLMAGVRQSGREPGKPDPIDAEAVALDALRHSGLPIAELNGPAREVKLLSDYRRDLVLQRTRIAAQVRWHLHELDPDLQVPRRGPRRHRVVRDLLAELVRFDGVVARLARDLLERCHELNTQINELEKELRALVRLLAPSLLEIPGCGVLSAAVIVGETAGVHRFRDKDAYARFTSTASVPVWSGSSKGNVNRGGNRSMNCALHMIAITQARGVGPAGPTSTSSWRVARTASPPFDFCAASCPTSSSPPSEPTSTPMSRKPPCSRRNWLLDIGASQCHSDVCPTGSSLPSSLPRLGSLGRWLVLDVRPPVECPNVRGCVA